MSATLSYAEEGTKLIRYSRSLKEAFLDGKEIVQQCHHRYPTKPTSFCPFPVVGNPASNVLQHGRSMRGQTSGSNPRNEIPRAFTLTTARSDYA